MGLVLQKKGKVSKKIKIPHLSFKKKDYILYLFFFIGCGKVHNPLFLSLKKECL